MGRPKKEGGMSATDYKRAFNEKTMIVFPRMLSAGKKIGTKRPPPPLGIA